MVCMPAELLVDSGTGVNCSNAEFAQKCDIGWDSVSYVQATMLDGESSLVLWHLAL